MRGAPFSESRVGGTLHNGAAPILWVGIRVPFAGGRLRSREKRELGLRLNMPN